MFQTTKQNSMGYPTFRESQIQVTTPHVLGVCNYQILSIRWVNSPAGLGSCWYVMICPSTHAPRMLILSPVLQFTSPLLLKSNMSLGCIKVISHHVPPYPTMLLNLIMLVTSLSWLFSLSPATCAIERPCREVPWQRPGADHGEDIRIWEPSCLTWISMIDFSLQDCGGLYKKNKFWWFGDLTSLDLI